MLRGHFARRRAGLGRSADDESGFTLLEVVVSLLLLAIVSAASLQLFIRSMASADLQSQRQQAVELANRQLETVRSLPASSLVLGRTKAEVDTLWASPWPVDTSQSLEYWDAAATGSSADTVPTVLPPVTLNAMTYTVRTFVDHCYQLTGGTSCGTTQPAGATLMIRVAVGVTWNPGGTRSCGTSTGQCGYVATTLVDPSSDPTFNSNG